MRMPKVNTRALNSLALAFVKDKLVLKSAPTGSTCVKGVAATGPSFASEEIVMEPWLARTPVAGTRIPAWVDTVTLMNCFAVILL